MADIRNRIARLRDEEAHLGRLLVTGKLSAEVYDQLRLEWQEKLDLAEADLASLEREAVEHLDDLDAALALLGEAEELYPRLDIEKRITLLKTLLKKLVVDEAGAIVDFELHAPSAYLQLLKWKSEPSDSIRTGSGHVPTGALYIRRPVWGRSAFISVQYFGN